MIIAVFIPSCSNGQSYPETTVNANENAVQPEEDEEENDSALEEDFVFPIDLSGETYKLLLIGSDEIPLNEPFHSITAGVQDAVSYLNGHQGINGAKIDLLVRSVDTTVEQLEEQILELLLEEDPLFAFLSVPVSENLYEKLNGQSVPVLYFGVGGKRITPSSSGRDNLFWLTPYPDEQMAFVFENLRSDWKSVSPATSYLEMIGAYLSWEGEYGEMAISPLLERYFEERAFQITVKDTFEVSANANLSNAILASLTSSVGVIYTDTYSFGTAVIANDVTSLGMVDFFVYAGSVWGSDGLTEDYLLATPFAGELFVPLSVVWWEEEDDPSIEIAGLIAEFSHRDPEEQDFGYLLGLGSVDIAAHVIETAARETGDGDLPGREIYLYLNSLKNYSVLDGLFEVDFTGRNRAPQMLQLWQYENGVWKAVSEMEEVPDLAGE